MSEWTDLKLAHSLTRVKAPEALWDRIQAAQAGVVEARPRYRWSMSFALAACVLLLLLVVRASALELRGSRTEFVSNDPVAMSRWLAHQGGRAPAVRVKDASVRTTLVAMNSGDASCRACHSL